MTELLKCLVCGSTDLINYLNLGDQPLANSFPAKAEEELPKFPLRLNYCNSCSHNQLSELVDPEVLFKDYLYVSGTSNTLKDHFLSLARDCSSRLRGGARPTVLSIGCNDATDLEAFQSIGFDVLGCDPAENLRHLSAARGIPVEVALWEDKTAKKIGREFDVILGCNVLAHNYDPVGFLRTCEEWLAPEGIVVLEFPLWSNSVKSGDLGQVYHEHISYMTIKSILDLVENAGLFVDDVMEFPKIHGGTLRVVLRAGFSNHCEKVLNMLKTEKAQGFHDIAVYENFAQEVLGTVLKLTACINMQKQLGMKVVGYGAAAKTSTIMNTAPGFLKIDYIVDDAPLKAGRFVPGTEIPILPTSALEGQEGLLAIVLFAHNFKDEIKERIKLTRPRPGDILINIVPQVSTEDIHD